MGSRLPFKLAKEAATARWYLLDARKVPVGRLACQIARIIQGKHKPIYDPSVDCGDNVVVINCKDVAFTGRKWQRKLYRWHTGYPGGLVTRTAGELHERQPDKALFKAISGMLPKNRLRRERMKRVRIFTTDKHPHGGLIEALPTHLHPKLSEAAREARGAIKETEEERFARLRNKPGYYVSWSYDADGNLLIEADAQHRDLIKHRPAPGVGLFKKGDRIPFEEASQMKPAKELPMFKDLLHMMKGQEGEADNEEEKKE